MAKLFEPQDPDFDARVRQSFNAQSMMHTLGITIAELSPGRIVLEFDHDERFTQQHGFVHGGTIATVMDSACGYAAFSLMSADAAVLTVEYKINMLRPAKADRYRVIGTVVKAGRTLTVSQATATSTDNDDEFATMTGTLMSLVDAGIQH